jgi:hypothetical protein
MANPSKPSHDNTPSGPAVPDHSEQLNYQNAADLVEEAALASFPASEPPAWSPLPVGPPHRAFSECEEQRVSYQWPTETPEASSDALVDTLHRLEAGLASAPFRDQEWVARSIDELQFVQKALGRHPATDQDADAFLADLDVTPWLARRGRKLSKDHADLLLQTRMLLVLLGRGSEGEAPEAGMIHRRLDLLLRGLRQQETLEKEVVFRSLCLDIGTGD